MPVRVENTDHGRFIVCVCVVIYSELLQSHEYGENYMTIEWDGGWVGGWAR